jgi:hypothetical protein
MTKPRGGGGEGYNDDLWHGAGTPAGQILYGCIGEEQAGKPGVYNFCSTCGIVVNDAHILSPDADKEGGGESTKPRPGSPCVALMSTNGAACFIVGFHRAPQVDEESDDIPEVGNPDDNASAGDKVYKTSGGATLVLKRGGAVFVEAGPGVSIICNPQNNRMTMRSANYKIVADGYYATRGRLLIGNTEPETKHTERFLSMAGGDHDEVEMTHGFHADGKRKNLQISSVTVIAGTTSRTVKTRETYYDDGSWVGEGPKYQWGGSGADEPMVLGNQLVSAFETLFGIIKALKVNTAWGPSTPPIPPTPIDIDKLQNELSGKILSTFLLLSKDPVSF